MPDFELVRLPIVLPVVLSTLSIVWKVAKYRALNALAYFSHVRDKVHRKAAILAAYLTIAMGVTSCPVHGPRDHPDPPPSHSCPIEVPADPIYDEARRRAADMESANARTSNFALQLALKELKDTRYDPGPVDGIKLKRTVKALNAFARDHGYSSWESGDPSCLKRMLALQAWTSAFNVAAPAP